MKTVDWSPDGLQLASGDNNGIIQVLANLFLRVCLHQLFRCVGFRLDSFGDVHGMFMMNA